MTTTTDIIETDERHGLPSSSGMQRIMSCPACLPFTDYLRARDLLPPDHASDDAEHGTEVHRICAQLALGEEPTGEPGNIDEAKGLWETAQQEIMKAFGKSLDELKIIVEERYWHVDRKGDRIASGRFDLIAMEPGTGNAVLIDYKTGHNDVPHPEDNWQLKHGAVLLALNLEAANVIACIIQTERRPMAKMFDGEEIADWDEEILAYLEACKVGHYLERGFNPTPHNCHYCPARLHCPRLLADLEQLEGLAITIPHASQMVACSSTPVLSEFLAKCETVELLAKAAKAEMTARLERGETDERYHLEAAAPKRKVVNAHSLANALIGEGAKTNDVIASMSMTIGAAEKVLKDATGLKGKKLKERLEWLAGPDIELSEPTPTLKRK